MSAHLNDARPADLFCAGYVDVPTGDDIIVGPDSEGKLAELYRLITFLPTDVDIRDAQRVPQ